MKKLGEVRCIPNLRRNLILLSRLDSSSYKWGVNDRILKVVHGNRIILKGKKCEGYYLLAGSSVQDGAPGASRSSA